MKPTIAILGGTGKEGTGLALRWATNGYTIIIGSRKAEKAEAAASALNEQLGITTITGYANGDAARKADIAVLTVVASAHQAALEGLRDDLRGKIVIDATARVAFPAAAPPAPPSAGRIAQNILGDSARVVAALQNVPAHALKHNLDQPLDLDVLVCADDAAAAETAMQLIAGAGMRAYFAGNLDNAIVVEGITALLISLNRHYKSKAASIKVTGIG